SVANIAINCVDLFFVRVNVSGHAGLFYLQNNASDDLLINTNGVHTFITKLPSGSEYDVTVSTQPGNAFCEVENGSGTLSANVTNVNISCAYTYVVGVSVSGLLGSITLQNNGTDDLVINQDGDYLFSNKLTDGSAFNLT